MIDINKWYQDHCSLVIIVLFHFIIKSDITFMLARQLWIVVFFVNNDTKDITLTVTVIVMSTYNNQNSFSNLSTFVTTFVTFAFFCYFE